MATIVLGAVGAYFGGPVGYAVGAAAGAYLDSKYLFPQEQLEEEVNFAPSGARLQGFQIQSGAEGTPISFLQGPSNRLAGQIIWISDLIENANVSYNWVTEPSSIGKGSGSHSYYNKTTTYSYSIDVAIALGEGILEGVDKAWANGKVFFESPDLVNFVSNLIRAEAFTVGNNKWVKIISPVVGPDLTNFKVGAKVTMSGWATSLLNNTFTIIETSVNPSNESVLTIRNNLNTQASEAAGASITVSQTSETFSVSELKDFRFFPGDLDQLPDPLIEAKEGTGNVPAFRNTSYVVLEGLLLTKFGNQLPQMSFLIREASVRTVGEAIATILIRAGFTPDQFDVTGVTDNLEGFSITGPQTTESLLKPLIRAFNLIVTDTNGTLIFVKRGTQVAIQVRTDDLGAKEFGSVSVRGMEITDTFGSDLPAEVNIGFIEPKIDHQQSNQRERRVEAPHNTVVTFNLPITMTATEARAIARRILWNAQINRRVISITLPPSYLDLQENDIIEFTFEDELYAVMIKKIDRGENTLLRIEGVVEFVNSNIQTGEEDPFSPVDATKGIFIGGGLAFEIIDIAPFFNDHMLVPGVYLAVALVDTEAEFSSAGLLKSQDGFNFISAGSIVEESVMGFVPALTPIGPFAYFDLGTTITVILLQGTLQSVTEDQLLEGANHAVIGNEVIGFQNAVLVDTNTYEISKLLRGRRNTEDQIPGHLALDERFVLIEKDNTQFTIIDYVEINKNLSFKAVPTGVPSGEVPAFPLIPARGNSIGTFAPEHVKGTRDTSNNLTIRWVRRSRAIVNLTLPNSTVPLLENSEVYEIDIFNIAFTTVLRTIAVEGPWPLFNKPETIYTAAQHIEDGLAPGTPVNMVIYQISEFTRRGNGKVATV